MARKITDETLKFNIIVDGNQGKKEYNALEKDTRRLIKANQDLEKEAKKLERANKQNSARYKELQTQIQNNTKTIQANQTRMKSLTTEIGLTNLSMKQLNNEARRLRAVMSNLNPNTTLWKQYNVQLQAVTKRQAQLRDRMRGTAGAIQQMQRSLMSTIGSFVSVYAIIYAVIGAFRDAFNRVREFDKEMQNLAGILGVSRGEISGLEKTIIDVAGASTRTSNEVAKLATSLISLGKSESEVKLLLKPVNDLSIALQASSDEAGEFLVQTLNAFGQSAEEGERYADIIAKVRTSTALDFQRLRDSLGYIAPTAHALGLSLERTSAILGVLNDNGIKAARAGRLMNTSFSRLVSNGISLEEALSQINNSTDKVSTATELFGAESFSLGLILSDNIDKTNRYAQEFANAGGTLDSLVNEQLNSLDAKLAIVDSAWERLILTIDNGDNVIGRFIKGSLTDLANLLDNITFLLGENRDNTDKLLVSMQSIRDTLKNMVWWYRAYDYAQDSLAKKFPKLFGWLTALDGALDSQVEKIKLDTAAREKNAEAVQAQYEEFIKLYGTIGPLTEEMMNNQSEDDFQFPFLPPIKETEKAITTIADLNERIKALNEELLSVSTREAASQIQQQIKELERQKAAILGTSVKKTDDEKEFEKRLKEIEKQEKRVSDFLRKEQARRNEESKTGLEKELAQLDSKYEEELAKLKEFETNSKEEEERINALRNQLLDEKEKERTAIILQNEIDRQNALHELEEQNRINEEAARLEREALQAETQAERDRLLLERDQYLANERLAIEERMAIEKARINGATEEEITALQRKFNIERQKNDAQFAARSKQIAEDERNFKAQQWVSYIQTLSGATDAIAELLGRQTLAGKLAGAATGLINTWQGVTEVWRNKSTLPEPLATIQKVAATATVLASGLNAVKQIKSAKVDGYEEGLYPVTRRQDGKRFNARFGGAPNTQIVKTPTLYDNTFMAGEAAPEMIIDGDTFRKMDPQITNYILTLAGKPAPGYERGMYPDTPPPAPKNYQDENRTSGYEPQLIDVLNRVLYRLDEPLEATAIIGDDEIRRQNKRSDKIRSIRNKAKINT